MRTPEAINTNDGLGLGRGVGISSTLAPSMMYPGLQASAAAQHAYTRWDGEDIRLTIYGSVGNGTEEGTKGKQELETESNGG